MNTTFEQADFKVDISFLYKGKEYVVAAIGLFYDKQTQTILDAEYGIKAFRRHDCKYEVFIVSNFADEQIDIL